MADIPSTSCHLLALPLEIIFSIWQYLDKKSLKSLRLTSGACRKHSDQPLFFSFSLYPHVRSFERLLQLSEQPKLAQHVRIIDYNTILLGLTEIINRRLASVYSAQISESERQKVVNHARQLHKQNLRPDAPFDELAQLSYLEKILHGLPNLTDFTVIDATGLQRPSNELIDFLPSFYQQLIDETCGRFEHTRLENGMFGTPVCRGGSYCRAVILSLQKAPEPITVLKLRGVKWPALFSSTDFMKNKLLVNGIFSNIKHFEVTQSHSSLFPGPICLASLQRVLSQMVKLEILKIYFREARDMEVRGRGTELRDVVNGVRCESYFTGVGLEYVGDFLPSRLNWSPGLRHLTLTGLVCSAKEMKSILRYCASSLRTLSLGGLVLTPDVLDGPRSCLVSLFKWMQSRLNLEDIELFDILTNGGMQSWVIDPTQIEEGSELLCARVYRFILNGGSCPLDHVAIPSGYYDVGKKAYTAMCPENFEAEYFLGDASWEMDYDEEEEDLDDASDWADNHHNMMIEDFDLEDDFEDEDMFEHQAILSQGQLAQLTGFIEEQVEDLSDHDV